MWQKLVLQVQNYAMGTIFSFWAFSGFFISIVTFPANAQDYWYSEHSKDKSTFESGGENGKVCLHVSSSVVGQPKLLGLERNAPLEVEAIISETELREDFVKLIEYSLQQYGFIKVGENTYELPETSLCVLKIYWNESRTSAWFTQYYKGRPERDGVLFDKWYNPEDLTTLLNKVFLVSGLAEHARAYIQLLLIHFPIRSLPPPTPLDNH